MKCPHCLIEFHDSWSIIELPSDEDGSWRMHRTSCPSCKKMTLHLLRYMVSGGQMFTQGLTQVYPKGTSRSPLGQEVPEKYAKDYKQSCLVLVDSPEASAALSRRCLQGLLRDIAKVKVGNLDNEIQQVLDSKSLPSQLAGALDAIRVIGNFALHPTKSTNSGEILEVEAGEAEWSLDTLEGLIDFYFIQPAVLQKKKDALNKKLQSANKPPLK